MMFGLCVLVFAAAYAYDMANTRFLRAVAEGRPGVAARWSVCTYMIGLIGLAGVLKYSLWLIIPEALGVYFGTRQGVVDGLPKATARQLRQLERVDARDTVPLDIPGNVSAPTRVAEEKRQVVGPVPPV